MRTHARTHLYPLSLTNRTIRRHTAFLLSLLMQLGQFNPSLSLFVFFLFFLNYLVKMSTQYYKETRAGLVFGLVVRSVFFFYYIYNFIILWCIQLKHLEAS